MFHTPAHKSSNAGQVCERLPWKTGFYFSSNSGAHSICKPNDPLVLHKAVPFTYGLAEVVATSWGRNNEHRYDPAWRPVFGSCDGLVF